MRYSSLGAAALWVDGDWLRVYCEELAGLIREENTPREA